MSISPCVRLVRAWTALVCLSIAGFAHAASITVNVEDENGDPLTGGFRWLVEEDRTFAPPPGVSTPDILGVNFHPSHNPVMVEGSTNSSATTISEIAPGEEFGPGRYYVSVLPFEGHQLSGAPVEIAGGDVTVTVVVNANPMPLAQITVRVFDDSAPINNAQDEGELPLGIGSEHPDCQLNSLDCAFSVLLFDAAGQYGVAGGQILEDACGNPLGSTYTGTTCDDLDALGNGVLQPDADGALTIKHVLPGKYGIQVVPHASSDWVQTTTLEGGKTIDAWVRAGEPPYFKELGPPGPHVLIGFIKPKTIDPGLGGTATISGTVKNLRISGPPVPLGTPFNDQFSLGEVRETCWVGLNLNTTGQGVYAQPCVDGSFTISNVPAGSHQVVIWDTFLTQIIGFANVDVTEGESVAMGDVGVFNWFFRLQQNVFFDADEDGFRDPGEVDFAVETGTNLRFRDGRIYQSFPTDFTASAPYDEVFPFFAWLVAETDFARWKATGATVWVDAGGPPSGPWDPLQNPQDQGSHDPSLGPDPAREGHDGIPPENITDYRVETGPVLLEGVQGILGLTSIIEWGKTIYQFDENGGITGIVFYATTRAEDDPRFAAGEEWEPGVPRVQVNLYRDSNNDTQIDDVNGDSATTLADVDNYPQGDFPGPGDVDRNGNNAFDTGDAVQITWTDSFDDSQPTHCKWDGRDNVVDGAATDCFDGLRNFSQIRPAVFDGGYAFDSVVTGGLNLSVPSGDDIGAALDGASAVPMPQDVYIVEAATPRGYTLLKEEDKNVDFGDEVAIDPDVAQLAAICVGDNYVPDVMSFDGVTPAPFQGENRRLCDRKQVVLLNGSNTAADFFVFTLTPKAAQATGFVLDDLANEFDPNAPNFGEKYAPPWLPITFFDWQGHVVNQVYGDKYGYYNALLPSTYSVNAPHASGVMPGMWRMCMNDPRIVTETGFDVFGVPTEQQVLDPFYDPRYSTSCFTFQFMPGATTYLDTPVERMAAHASVDTFPVDCEQPDGRPAIGTVIEGSAIPLVNNFVHASGSMDIFTAGVRQVRNPEYDGSNDRFIDRDYSFGGGTGQVLIDGVPTTSIPWADIDSWTSSIISVDLTAAPPGEYEVTVANSDGVESAMGITVTVAPNGAPNPIMVPGNYATIQAAIDAAVDGELVVVGPGIYDELLIMDHPVKLQGAGPFDTLIIPRVANDGALIPWREDVAARLTAGDFDLLPGQEPPEPLPPGGEPVLFTEEEGPGLLVVANVGEYQGQGARIDGFGITGAQQGGAVFLNAYVEDMTISNNRLIGNSGSYSGAIRVGNTSVGNADILVADSDNDRVDIHHNHIAQNGNLFQGAGAGVSIYKGAEDYRVANNFICGNFSQAGGGGFGHYGLSDGGVVEDNVIVFNQSFDQGTEVHGGGALIMGAPSPGGEMTEGAGDVDLIGNRIQGNQAGAGDGGGVSLLNVNGLDVEASPNNENNWHRVRLLNNIIANNVSGKAGAGVSLQDAARVDIFYNTIANNDSTATVGSLFNADQTQSTARPSGIASYTHSPGLNGAIGSPSPSRYASSFSNPNLRNSIVYHNRSFQVDTGTLVPAVPQYQDLDVVGAGSLDPQFSLLTDTGGYDANNLLGDPQFVLDELNTDNNLSDVLPEINTLLAVSVAADEGGNFVDVRFGPLSLNLANSGDYHITPGSDAQNEASGNLDEVSNQDIDDNVRPDGPAPDIGADEIVSAGGGGGLAALALEPATQTVVEELVVEPQPTVELQTVVEEEPQRERRRGRGSRRRRR